MRRAAAFLRLVRPLQWSKNAFVLVGILFAHRLDAPTLIDAGLVLVAFCCIASAAYVFNDIQDLHSDRAHPVKRHRPLASGEISLRWAWMTAALLQLSGVTLAAAASAPAATIALIYGVLNVAYSLRLKHVVIVDVFIIAAGFMLRILAGTVGIGIPPSSWLLVCGLMLTLFLGFSKRVAELQVNRGSMAGHARKVLDTYQLNSLQQFQSITATATIMTYALYAMNSGSTQPGRNESLIYTVPLVTFGILRYMHLVQVGRGGEDPARDLLRDPSMWLTILAWLLVTAWMLT